MNIEFPIILDGGLSNELEKAGFNLDHNLWTAKLIATNPDAIINVHLDYLNAGAECITTSSYQATIQSFLSFGYDKVSAEKLILKSVELAEKARAEFLRSSPKRKKPLIAASIGSYGAFLADGSEYDGLYGVSDNFLKEFHESRIYLLDLSSADFFACETIPNFQEAKILGELLANTNKSAWISFSCKDGNHINDGTTIEECAKYFSNHNNVFAIGINCTAPQYVSSLLQVLNKNAGGKKIVVYANSGEQYNAKTKEWSYNSKAQSFQNYIKEWMEIGVDIIGGCWRIGPEQIRGIVKSVADN